ncbi:MAG: gamma-glutamyl-gamma-aminobutyrate hydrolase family protein [Acidimicrobiia bacterium]|nr:gamma-glutamyl-gamma-aminobutyrate hydrolase family protein [Acidimicrobiia bacterium]
MGPLIGITTQARSVVSSAGEIVANTLAHTYSDSVLRAGGVPVLLPPMPEPRIEGLVSRLDGLVLSGGGDMDPARYGSQADETCYGIDFDRDAFELALARVAHQTKLPTLAICRGLQVMNVALGGTLFVDLPTEVGSMEHSVVGSGVWERHQHVKVEDESRVALAMQESDVMVNSIHHQAVKDLGDGLRPVAWADDGVVEALQHEDEDWDLLAVQWHPEYLGDRDDIHSHRLFDALVAAASA